MLRLYCILIFCNSIFAYAQKPAAGHLYPILWKWLQGTADSAYVLSDQQYPGLSDNLKHAFQVRRAREFWYQKNMDSFNAGHCQWLPVTGFLGRFQTFRGLFRSGFDMVEQALGTYTVHVTPVSRDSIRFTVLDIKSRWSLFLHLPFAHHVPYNRYRARQKPMTDMYWLIEWVEPVSASLFYQRRLNVMQYKHRHYSGHNF